jgi:hypothetical protein
MARSNGCSNLECKNGVTPGVILIGGGRNSAPLINNGVMQKTGMRWGWIRCTACRPEEKDPPWKPKSLTQEQIDERRRWADAKAAYVEPQQKRLEKIKLKTPDVPTLTPSTEPNAELMRMIEQNDKLMLQISGLTDTVGKLSGQVADLLAENARLRTAPQEPQTALSPPSGSGETPKRRKSRQIAKPS